MAPSVIKPILFPFPSLFLRASSICKQSTVKRRFRMVCAFNSESGEYHTYLTNIRVDVLSAEEIALLYGARWEIELIFKELKSHYRMDQIPSTNPNIVKCLIWNFS